MLQSFKLEKAGQYCQAPLTFNNLKIMKKFIAIGAGLFILGFIIGSHSMLVIQTVKHYKYKTISEQFQIMGSDAELYDVFIELDHITEDTKNLFIAQHRHFLRMYFIEKCIDDVTFDEVRFIKDYCIQNNILELKITTNRRNCPNASIVVSKREAHMEFDSNHKRNFFKNDN